jgi:hypothetical protein
VFVALGTHLALRVLHIDVCGLFGWIYFFHIFS